MGQWEMEVFEEGRFSIIGQWLEYGLLSVADY